MPGTAGTVGGTTSMIGEVVAGAGAIVGGAMVTPCGAGVNDVLAGGVVDGGVPPFSGTGIFFGGVVMISPAGAGAGADGAQAPLAQPGVPQPPSQLEPWPRPPNRPLQRDRKPPPPWPLLQVSHVLQELLWPPKERWHLRIHRTSSNV